MTQPEQAQANDNQPERRPEGQAEGIPAIGADAGKAQVLTITSPEDLLAAMPLLFGFMPEESVVMMTMGGRRPFHARADIPDLADARGLTDSLVHALRRHDCRRVALVVVTTSGARARLLLTALRAMFANAEIEVLADVATDGFRWWAGDDLDPQSPGISYDITGHRFRADAVLRGEVVGRTRRDIAALVAPGSVSESLTAEIHRCAEAAPIGPGCAEGMLSRVRAAIRTDEALNDATLAAVLAALESVDFAERVQADLRRSTGAQQARWWASVARRSPDPWGAHAAALTAMAAWLSGDGALAWCAVDRTRAALPDHRLAALVATLIETAQAPQDWEATHRPRRSA